MSSIVFASHVESSISNKRSLADSGYSVPKRSLNADPRTLPATTARPDQRVNVRVPVTRSTATRLFPGQIAFVQRSFGKYHPSAKASLGGLVPIVSIELLNDMLAQGHNHAFFRTAFPGILGNKMMKTKTAKSIWKPGTNGKKVRTTFKAFDTSFLPDEHPVNQFALDGLVAASVEAGDDAHSSKTFDKACVVAVKGHAPMRTTVEAANLHTGVHQMQFVADKHPINYFCEPHQIMSKLFVVLVAVVEDRGRAFVPIEKRFDVYFRYEVVSSTNLGVNPSFVVGYKLFRDRLFSAADSNSTLGTPNGPNRVVCRVFELGSIVDTNFGPSTEPHLTVCVHIDAVEKVVAQTSGGSTHAQPVDVRNTFDRVDVTEARIQRTLKLGLKSSSLKRSFGGSRPATGNAAADLSEVKTLLSRMTVRLSEIEKKLNDNAAALNSLDRKVDADAAQLQQVRTELATLVKTEAQAISTESSAKVDEVMQLINEFTDAFANENSVKLQKRLLEFLNAKFSNADLTAETELDKKLKAFAEKISADLEQGTASYDDFVAP